MSNKTEPRTLAGFMELMPNEQILFEQMKQKIENIYRKFGFLPLDTPILELSEVLLAKAGGETEKQIYRFEKGDTDISMRFDLTVPLAKYVAKNYGNLSFPFRRYQIGKEAVIEELEKISVPINSINKILEFIEIEGTTDEKLQKLQNLNIENEAFKTGLEELTQVVKYIRLFGIPEQNFKVDLTIARGLDYYTGTVYETFLNEYRELGSVCSGGRYENLAENYTDKKLPGVGISIGLTRLFYKLNELNLIKANKKSISDVLIIPMLEDLTSPIKIANDLRKNGINTEIFLNDKKLKAKMKYADKLEIPFVIVVGEDEVNSGVVKVKDMRTGNEEECKIDSVSQLLKTFIEVF